LLWDDPMGQFTQAILGDGSLSFEECNENALIKIKEYFANWDCIHFGWDSGHIQWVKDLGILPVEQIKYSPLPAHIDFLRRDKVRKTKREIAFFGNLYLNMLKTDQFFQDKKTVAICKHISGCDIFTFQKSNYFQFKEILSNVFQIFNKKWEDDINFWAFYRKLIWYYFGTHKRKLILENISHNINFFGNFADESASPLLSKNLLFQGNLDFFSELPLAFEETEITVDVINSISINGLTGKFYECFASNGFMLFDYKPDAEVILGKELTAKVTYRSIDELNDKIQFYLKNKQEREELRINIKTLILNKCDPQEWSQKILIN